MSRSRRILLLVFLESFASMMVQRGVYFYCRYRLGFSDADNLWLALAFGATYVTGALLSHWLAGKCGEQRLLVATIVVQIALQATLAAWVSVGVLYAVIALVGWVNGLKWPVIESYASAGHDAPGTARAVGRFNLSWASAGPLALVVAGPIIAAWGPGIFLLGSALNVVTACLAGLLAAQPAYLPADHPDRPRAQDLPRMLSLLASSRWLMLLSYTFMRILDPVLPQVTADLRVPVQWATALVATMDLWRLGMFALLQWRRGWHGRLAPLAGVLVGLPGGFFLIVFSPNLGALGPAGAGVAVLLAGELAFGAAAGMTYYAALYYAMVARGAAVNAGGGHEAMIGTGFVLGPAAGLAGVALAPVMQSQVLGAIAGVGPVTVLCVAGAVWAVVAARHTVFGKPRR